MFHAQILIIVKLYTKYGKRQPFPKLKPCVSILVEEDIREQISLLVARDNLVSCIVVQMSSFVEEME